jgi:rod shape-determining protein MreC
MKKDDLRIYFIAFIALSAIFIVLDRLSALNWLKSLTQRTTNPFKHSIHIYNVDSDQKEETEQKMDQAKLQAEIDKLKQENEDMKRLLGAPLPPSWHFIPAKVLKIEKGVMTINQGSKAGVKENQTVVYENVLIGRVSEVQPNLSKIILPTNKEEIQAKVSSTNVQGIVKSEGEVLKLTEVLQEKSLENNQIIITSGAEEKYREGLIIGKVSQVDKDEVEIYKKATIELIIDYQNLVNVFVVKD